MSFRATSIRAKLIAAFSIVIIFIIAIGSVGLWAASAIHETLLEVEGHWLPSAQLAGQIDTVLGRYTTSLIRDLITQDPKMQAAVDSDLTDRRRKLEVNARKYEGLIRSAEDRALYEASMREWHAFEAVVGPILALSRKGDKAEALSVYEKTALQPRRNLSIALERMIQYNHEGAKQAEAESLAAYTRARTTLIAAGSLAVILAITLAAAIIAGISRGIQSVVRPMESLAAGDLTVAIPLQGAKTEIGSIASAVQVFKDGLIRMRELEMASQQARLAAEEQRKVGMRQMADSFETAVGGVIELVSSSATELQATAHEMSRAAAETAARSAAATDAAASAASNAGTVAAAAEELGSSVAEIGRQVNGSAQLARHAVSEAGEAGILVQELSEAVSRIGDVVGLISTIAGQTNLLALNATIEAARAGDAGKGFAVVAAEVKALAAQTATATEEISSQIAQIQASTGRAVTSIDGITGRIGEISTVATAIAAAVEQQDSATQEIVRNVAQAAVSTGEVTENISGAARAAGETGASADQVLGAATELSRQSETLTAEVARFLKSVRAA